MELKKLLSKQKELDNLIFKNAEISEYPKEKIKLALLVELGELANEVQSFKYWKKEQYIVRSKIEEEWADCFHFALSLENELHQANEAVINHIDLILDKEDIDKAFLVAFSNVSDEQCVLATIVALGRCLDISLEEMEAAYNKKYKKNIERQQQGY
ncbi:MAG: dUTP diphosphatase [Bacillota bacterium]|nr:dUTP diphosphatase [Bacillota bacterium]